MVPISSAVSSTAALMTVAASPTSSDSQPGTDDEAAQDIAADLIGAHQVLQRRPGEPVGQVPLGDRIGRDQIGEDGHQNQGQDHQGAGQTHALPGQCAQELDDGVAPYGCLHW